jgi:hypothetical protein
MGLRDGQEHGQQHTTIPDCPFCGVQMEQGYLQSARQIFFSPKKHKVNFRPDADEVAVTEDMLSNACDALFCPNCHVVIVQTV